MVSYLVMFGIFGILAFLFFYCISDQDVFFYFFLFFMGMTIFLVLAFLAMSLVQ